MPFPTGEAELVSFEVPDLTCAMTRANTTGTTPLTVAPGNIGKERRESFTKPSDLATPTLKSDHYTTGRGGSGNIAKNDPEHPELARAAQDVAPVIKREPDGLHHYGRGGAANVVATGDGKDGKSEEEHKSLLEKAKETLGLGKK